MSIALVACAVGCAARVSTLEIVDHRTSGSSRHYREQFDEAYYCFDETGAVDIVLRRSAGGQTGQADAIRQVVHVRSLWRSIPGRTVAHSTQINATIVYNIVSGHIGATFEGAGSVFFTCNRRTGELTGVIEWATLRPMTRTADGAGLFERAELTGTFRATRDPRRVVRMVNEITRRAGPLTTAQRRRTG